MASASGHKAEFSWKQDFDGHKYQGCSLGYQGGKGNKFQLDLGHNEKGETDVSANFKMAWKDDCDVGRTEPGPDCNRSDDAKFDPDCR